MENQRKSGAILSYVYIIINCVLGLVYVKFLRDKLGQAEYGMYGTVDSVIAYLAVLDCGFGNAIIRYTARYRANNDKDGEYRLNGMFLILYSIIGIIAFVVGTIICQNIGAIYGGNADYSANDLVLMQNLMRVMVINVAVTFPLSIFSAIVTAYERFNVPKILNIVRALLKPCIMVPLLFMGYKSMALVIVTTILNIGILLFNVVYCFKILKIKIIFDKFNKPLLKEISIYSFYILLNILVDKIYLSTDNIILSILINKTSVAIYTLAMQLYHYYFMFSTAINGVFLPQLSIIVANAEKEKNEDYNKDISDIFIKVGRIQFMIVALVLVGFIIVGKDFILRWGGIDYSDAYYIEIILMIPALIPLVQNTGISILQAKNIHKFRSIVYIIIAFANIGLSIPLTMAFSGIGAAIGTAIATIIGQGIIMNWYYYKKAKIDIPRFWKEISHFIPSLIVFLVLGVTLNLIWVNGSYFAIITKAIICTCVYFITLWIYGMNEYEKGLVKGIFRKLKLIK